MPPVFRSVLNVAKLGSSVCCRTVIWVHWSVLGLLGFLVCLWMWTAAQPLMQDAVPPRLNHKASGISCVSLAALL